MTKPSMSKPTVLIADDDIDLVEALSRRCRELGLAVYSANDAPTALHHLRLARPDVVLLDHEMPGGDGLQIRETMLGDEQWAAIPTILLTGLRGADIVRRCHELCAYYIPKTPGVWDHVRPLLLELVPRLAGDAPAAGVVTAPVAGVATPAPTSKPEEARGRRPRNNVDLVDLVFSLLGSDEESDETTSAAARDEAAVQLEVESRPWILCIDDDADHSYSLKLRLRQQGFEVLRAFEGMEGYRYAFATQAQAIILDYEMPNGDGSYVLRRLKENPVTRDIPVIVLTGRNERVIERQMYSQGAAEFLTKPCEWERLWAALRRHIPCELCS